MNDDELVYTCDTAGEARLRAILSGDYEDYEPTPPDEITTLVAWEAEINGAPPCAFAATAHFDGHFSDVTRHPSLADAVASLRLHNETGVPIHTITGTEMEGHYYAPYGSEWRLDQWRTTGLSEVADGQDPPWGTVPWVRDDFPRNDVHAATVAALHLERLDQLEEGSAELAQARQDLNLPDGIHHSRTFVRLTGEFDVRVEWSPWQTEPDGRTYRAVEYAWTEAMCSSSMTDGEIGEPRWTYQLAYLDGLAHSWFHEPGFWLLVVNDGDVLETIYHTSNHYEVPVDDEWRGLYREIAAAFNLTPGWEERAAADGSET